MKLRLLSITILILFSKYSFAQIEAAKVFTKGESDTLYYDELKSMLTLRLFSATKFTDFSLIDNTNKAELNYNANPTQSIGVGASFKGLSLNLGYGFSFNNQDDSLYGHTQHFDFLTQIYTRKLAINIYSNAYRGFYLDNTGSMITNWPKGKYYTRPGITSVTFGVSASYYFNYKHFSNRATFVQNEWQKKSAGSFILGSSIVVNHIKSDSSFIPQDITEIGFFEGYNYLQSDYFTFGTHVGYSYILVLKKRLFINLGVNVGLLWGKLTTYDELQVTKWKKSLNFTILPSIAFGYNSKRFYAGFNYSSFTAVAPTPIVNTSQAVTNGKYQFVYAYRFKVRKDFRILPKNWPIDF